MVLNTAYPVGESPLAYPSPMRSMARPKSLQARSRPSIHPVRLADSQRGKNDGPEPVPGNDHTRERLEPRHQPRNVELECFGRDLDRLDNARRPMVYGHTEDPPLSNKGPVLTGEAHEPEVQSERPHVVVAVLDADLNLPGGIVAVHPDGREVRMADVEPAARAGLRGPERIHVPSVRPLGRDQSATGPHREPQRNPGSSGPGSGR